MSNPNIPLDMSVAALPAGLGWMFNWEHDGNTYQYYLSTSGMRYSDVRLSVRGGVRLEKYQIIPVRIGWLRFTRRRLCWSVEGKSYVDLLDPRDVASELVPAAAQKGVILSPTILARCNDDIGEVLNPIREAVFAAQNQQREELRLKVA